MTKIFIDVGGHCGGTLNELFGLPHRFDVVHCLEPQAACFSALENTFAEQIAAGELFLHNYGLADFDGESTLYGESLSGGASLFLDKVDIDNRQTEKCKFVKASTFVGNVASGANDFVVMKLNCEGGEALILRDLMKEKAIHRLNSVYVDFDIDKIPSQAAEEQKIVAEMKACHYDNYVIWNELQTVNTFSFCRRRQVPRKIGGHKFPRLKVWLSSIENAGEIIHLRGMGWVAHHLPKFIWGRLYRIKRLCLKPFRNKPYRR